MLRELSRDWGSKAEQGLWDKVPADLCPCNSKALQRLSLDVPVSRSSEKCRNKGKEVGRCTLHEQSRVEQSRAEY